MGRELMIAIIGLLSPMCLSLAVTAVFVCDVLDMFSPVSRTVLAVRCFKPFKYEFWNYLVKYLFESK